MALHAQLGQDQYQLVLALPASDVVVSPLFDTEHDLLEWADENDAPGWFEAWSWMASGRGPRWDYVMRLDGLRKVGAR